MVDAHHQDDDIVFTNSTKTKRRGPPLAKLDTAVDASSPPPGGLVGALCACPASVSYSPTPVASNRGSRSKGWTHHQSHKKRQIIPQETLDQLHHMLESLAFRVVPPSYFQQYIDHASGAECANQTDSSKSCPEQFQVKLYSSAKDGCGRRTIPTVGPPRCRGRSPHRNSGPSTIQKGSDHHTSEERPRHRHSHYIHRPHQRDRSFSKGPDPTTSSSKKSLRGMEIHYIRPEHLKMVPNEQGTFPLGIAPDPPGEVVQHRAPATPRITSRSLKRQLLATSTQAL